MKASIQEHFGELRSLLGASPKDKAWHAAMWSCICKGRGLDPRRFEEQWAPYIKSQHPDWRMPLATFVNDIDGLRQAYKIAPFASFALELKHNALGHVTTLGLAKRPELATVGFLDLEHCRLGRDGIRTLVSSPHLKRLKKLSIGFDWIGPDAVRAIAQAPHLRTLEALLLSQCKLSTDAIYHLAESPHLGNLRALDVSFIEMTEDALLALAQSPAMQNLETLNLQGCKITDRMLAAFVEEPDIEKLSTLELAFNPITDKGAKAIAKSPHLANLTRLHLVHDAKRETSNEDPTATIAVGREGLHALLASPHLSEPVRGYYRRFLEPYLLEDTDPEDDEDTDTRGSH